MNKLNYETIKTIKPEDSNAELAIVKITDPDYPDDQPFYDVIRVTGNDSYELASERTLKAAEKIFDENEEKFLEEYEGWMY